MRPHWLRLLLPLSLCCVSIGSAQAQPDAGSLRQQIEQARPLGPPLPAASLPPRPLAPAPLKDTAGVKILVKAFRFEGNTLVDSEHLTTTLAEFTGRELDFDGLQRAADAVAAAYRKAGWLVRVYLPEQDISAGLVTLQVVEARFGGVQLSGDAPRRVSPEVIEAFFLRQQPMDQPLSVSALDRALLLADDLPGVSVGGTLVPGPDEGQTSLSLRTADESAIYGDVSVDNTGARSTGSERVSVNLNINSPFQGGEMLALNLMRTRGSEYGRVALTLPVGQNGLRLGLNASALNYKVIDGPGYNSEAPIRGNSNSLGMDLYHPLLRSRMANVYLSGALEARSFFTQDTQVRSDYGSHVLRVGLSGNRFDAWGGGGASNATVQAVNGRLNRMQAHSQIDTIDRSFHKYVYSLSRLQNLTERHSVSVSFSGQYAEQVLDSSEKFYIGGAQSVRAYPASELGGERGQVLNTEWRWRPVAAWAFSAFGDLGRVISLPLSSGDPVTAYRLRGYGLSISWQGPSGVSARLTWSRRDGQNPKPTPSGSDGDGSLKLNRLWLATSVAF